MTNCSVLKCFLENLQLCHSLEADRETEGNACDGGTQCPWWVGKLMVT